jgi:HD-GYP domain-containing protein (c-di-GMP phosphodiesterase class II)
VVVDAARAALHETGDQFEITVSWGVAHMPDEAATVSDALSVADGRMYEHKRSRPEAGRGTTLALLAALAERDANLDQHVNGVADLALAVGGRFALDAEAMEELRAGAELHDIGKVAIPDAILYKPAALDPDEQEFMRRHTVMGERIVASVPSLRGAARLIRASHERWDGAGYPDGLAGEEIPLGARIIAVCDAYDAMTTDRPYRRAMAADAARAELRARAGTQFDPAVVEAFLGADTAVADLKQRRAA